MDKKPPEEEATISEVLAANLSALMKERGLTQAVLAAKSGIAQTTISLYLRPKGRKPGARGKVPSAKVAEVESLAKVLGVQIWELLSQMTEAERQLHRSVTKAVAEARAAKAHDDGLRFARQADDPPGKRRAA